MIFRRNELKFQYSLGVKCITKTSESTELEPNAGARLAVFDHQQNCQQTALKKFARVVREFA